MNTYSASRPPLSSLEITTQGKPWANHKELVPLFNTTLDITCKHLFEISYLSSLFNNLKERPLEISLLLAHNPFVQKLNKKWLHKNMPTNVLSFPFYEKTALLSSKNLTGDLQKIFLGDIVLSYEKCLEEAQDQKKPFLHHIQHLFTHGILHLLGFDHLTEQEAHTMESLEIKILSDLMIPNPYLHHT